MIRLEIYAHEALENILINALVPVPDDAHDPEGRSGRAFSLVRSVAGRGQSGSSMSNEIWPESNFKLILFIEESDLDEINKSIKQIKSQYPKLGLAVFAINDYYELI